MQIALLILFFFIAETSWAAKAAAVITSTQSTSQRVTVEVNVTEDSGVINFSTSFVLNFTSSINQIDTDIKQRVRDELVRLGIAITVNDIFLFGGAQ